MTGFLRTIAACCLASSCLATQAAVHCVSNAVQLKNALIDAAVSPGNDEVRIVQGTYLGAAVGGFHHTPVQPGNLMVSGGWTDGGPAGLPATCETQVRDPALTVLDGEYQHTALQIYVGTVDADFVVHNLTLSRGTSMGSGGGLSVYGFEPSWEGDVLLHSLRFIANEASGTGAGLYAAVPHGQLRVLNAAFVGNVAGFTGGAADIIANGSWHLVANLTVVGNAAGAPGGSALRVAGSAPALLMNTISWNNDDVDIELGGTGIRLHHNFYGTRSGNQPAEEAGTLAGNPMLGGGSMNLTPTAGSPLVDYGLPVPGGMPSCDVDNNLRMVGPALDVGAFESQVFADGYESEDPWLRPPSGWQH